MANRGSAAAHVGPPGGGVGVSGGGRGGGKGGGGGRGGRSRSTSRQGRAVPTDDDITAGLKGAEATFFEVKLSLVEPLLCLFSSHSGHDTLQTVDGHIETYYLCLYSFAWH